MLTAPQQRLFQFIVDYQVDRGGVSPSLDEMRQAMGSHGKGSVHAMLCRIESQGYINRRANRARAIEVLRPVVVYTEANATFKVVERVDDKAVLVPFKPKTV